MAVRRSPLTSPHASAPIRQFHSQIFDLNRTIRNEALGYMLRMHRFVRLEYRLPNFEAMRAAYDVPVIASPPVKASFQEHVLELEARVEDYEDPVRSEPKGMGLEEGLAFLLVEDLPALFEMLRVLALQTSAEFVFIQSVRGVPIHPGFNRLRGFTLKLDVFVRATASTRLSIPAQASLLENVREMRGNVKATLSGFAAPQVLGIHVDQVLEEIRPALMWRRARDWETLELMLRNKRRVDQLVRLGSNKKLDLALDSYERILLDSWQLHHHDPRVASTNDPALIQAHVLHVNLRWDLDLSMAQLFMATGRVRDAAQILSRRNVDRVMRSILLPEAVKIAIARLRLVFILLSYANEDKGPASLRRGLEQAGPVSDEHSEDDHLANDVGLGRCILHWRQHLKARNAKVSASI